MVYRNFNTGKFGHNSWIKKLALVIIILSIVIYVAQAITVGFLTVKVINDPTGTAQEAGNFIKTFLGAIKN